MALLYEETFGIFRAERRAEGADGQTRCIHTLFLRYAGEHDSRLNERFESPCAFERFDFYRTGGKCKVHFMEVRATCPLYRFFNSLTY